MQRPRSERAGGLFTEKEAQQYGCSIVIKEKIGRRWIPEGGVLAEPERAYEPLKGLLIWLREIGSIELFQAQEWHDLMNFNEDLSGCRWRIVCTERRREVNVMSLWAAN